MPTFVAYLLELTLSDRKQHHVIGNNAINQTGGENRLEVISSDRKRRRLNDYKTKRAL